MSNNVLPDMSFLMSAFLEQHDKNLFLLNAFTGSGKTTSVISLCKYLQSTNMMNNQYNMLIFASPNNDEAEKIYNSVSNIIGTDLCLRLYNTKKTYKDNVDVLKTLSLSQFGEENQAIIKKMQNAINGLKNDEIKEENVNEALEDYFSSAKNSFEEAAINYINSKWYEHCDKKAKKEKIRNDKRKEIAFIQKDEELSVFLKLIPTILIPVKRYVFTTVSKLFFSMRVGMNKNPYNYLHPIENNKCIYVIDEVDSSKRVLLEHILEASSGTEVDMIEVIKNSNCLSEHHIPNVDERIYKEIKKEIDLFHEATKKISDNYGIFKIELPSRNSHALFVDNQENIIHANNNNEKLYLIKQDKKSLIVSGDEKEKYQNQNKKIFDFDIVVKDVVRQFFALLDIIGKLAELYILENKIDGKEIEKRKREIVEDIIYDYIGKFNQKTIGNLALITLSRHGIFKDNPDTDKRHVDFYTNPGVVISIGSGRTGSTVEVKAAELGETPESILANLIRLHKVIGMSATANNKSVFHNYDVKYGEINEQTWKMSNDLFIKYKKYLDSRFENVDLVNVLIDFVPTKENISEIEKDIDTFINKNDETIYNKYQKILFDMKAATERQQRQEKGNCDFPVHRQLAAIYAILKAYELKRYKGLCLMSCGKNSKDYNFFFNKTLLELERFINENFDRKIRIFSTVKKDLDETNAVINDILASADGYNTTCIMVAPYETAGKAGNFQFKTNDERIIKDFIPISTYGENQLTEYYSDKTKELELNLDFIYIGEKTNILVGCGEKLAEDMLSNYYFIGALNTTGALTSLEYEELIRKASSSCVNQYNKSIFNVKKMRKKLVYAASALQYFEQATGRIVRSPHMRKDVICLIDAKYAQNIRDCDCDISKIYDEDDWDCKSAFTKKLVSALINYEPKIVSMASKKQSIDACKVIDDALIAINYNPTEQAVKEYQNLKSIRKLAVTENERKSMNKKKAKMYCLVKKEKILSSGGYSYNHSATSNFGSVITNNIYEKGATSLNVSRASFGIDDLPADIQKYLIDEGFNFDINKSLSYLLLPAGVSILQGELGESIVRYVVHSELEDLPVEVYEKADMVHVISDEKVIAIDAKYYRTQDVNYDGEPEKQKWFEKATAIQGYYEKEFGIKRIDYIVINARNNCDETKRCDVKTDETKRDVRLITFPNIYTKDDDGNKVVDKTVRQTINNIIYGVI